MRCQCHRFPHAGHLLGRCKYAAQTLVMSELFAERLFMCRVCADSYRRRAQRKGIMDVVIIPWSVRSAMYAYLTDFQNPNGNAAEAIARGLKEFPDIAQRFVRDYREGKEMLKYATLRILPVSEGDPPEGVDAEQNHILSDEDGIKHLVGDLVPEPPLYWFWLEMKEA